MLKDYETIILRHMTQSSKIFNYCLCQKKKKGKTIGRGSVKNNKLTLILRTLVIAG